MGTVPAVADTDGDGVVDGLQLSKHPGTARVLPADGLLHCLGWAGAPVLRGLDARGAWKGDRLAPEAEQRLVRGVGEQMLYWPEDPSARADTSCVENAGVIVLLEKPELVRVATSLSAALQGSLTNPLVVRLGTPSTTVESGVVSVSSTVVARTRRRPDVLAVLVELLADYANLGVPLEEAHLNDALAIRVGYGVLHVDVAAPTDARVRDE